MCWFTQNSLLSVSQGTDLKWDEIHIIFTRHLTEASGRGVTELIIYTKNYSILIGCERGAVRL